MKTKSNCETKKKDLLDDNTGRIPHSPIAKVLCSRYELPSCGMNNIIIGILSSIFLRWSTGLFDYSGKGQPPMYGDYEAHRHWMEITYHLPPSEWYFQSENNDLLYWGLDYPPLTAYHSFIMGAVANRINPKYIALNESRGFESYGHKLFMRYTVLYSDLLTYLLAAGLFSYVNNRSSNKSKFTMMLETYVLLAYPGIILIDYGHFQYNCVSLGLTLYSIIALGSGYDVLACIFYCLAVSYKQMLLYFSLPFFFYYLGLCRQKAKSNSVREGLKKFILISLTVSLTFAICWLPVSRNWEQFFQVIHRIFPIDRGVFEDKVSNFWCLLNVFVKIRLFLNNSILAMICGLLTLSASLPSCINLFFRPTKHKFILTLINSSLAFFMFSYQVHEKSILIVALPVMLIFRAESFHCYWFLIVSSFSMFPLLLKDGLFIPFCSLSTIFAMSLTMFYNIPELENYFRKRPTYHKYEYLFTFSMCSWIVILLSAVLLKPPERYPDIFPLMICCYSSIHFMYFFMYFNYVQLFKKHKKSS